MQGSAVVHYRKETSCEKNMEGKGGVTHNY